MDTWVFHFLINGELLHNISQNNTTLLQLTMLLVRNCSENTGPLRNHVHISHSVKKWRKSSLVTIRLSHQHPSAADCDVLIPRRLIHSAFPVKHPLQPWSHPDPGVIRILMSPLRGGETTPFQSRSGPAAIHKKHWPIWSKVTISKLAYTSTLSSGEEKFIKCSAQVTRSRTARVLYSQGNHTFCFN